jgi:hypothetical protein
LGSKNEAKRLAEGGPRIQSIVGETYVLKDRMLTRFERTLEKEGLLPTIEGGNSSPS